MNNNKKIYTNIVWNTASCCELKLKKKIKSCLIFLETISFHISYHILLYSEKNIVLLGLNQN